MVAVLLVVGAPSVQTVRAETEYELGVKQGIAASANNDSLKVIYDKILQHPHEFYEGWLFGFYHGDRTAGGSDADEFTFSCGDLSPKP